MSLRNRPRRSLAPPAVFGLLLTVLFFSAALTEARCRFPAIFNFGDSNSDTGGFWAAFPAQRGPNGMTYFKKPVGRATDGRVVVDFLGSRLAVSSPYLQSIGSNFSHGANFATLASTVLLPNTSVFVSGISPFSLAIQFNQMNEFRERVFELGTQDNLPSKHIFGKALYTLDIGQNDFTSNLAAIGIEGVKQYLPQVANQIAWTIKDFMMGICWGLVNGNDGIDEAGELYNIEGRTFMVFNLAPIGCYPAFLTQLPHNNSDLDEYGCMISYNNAVVDYNKLLKETLQQIQSELQNASVIYVDTHSVKLQVYQHPENYGLKHGTKACCGCGGGAYNYNPQVFCGNNKNIKGINVTANACSDPQNYVSWDGIHATDAANKIIANAILNGSYFDPPFPLSHLCNLKPIG